MNKSLSFRRLLRNSGYVYTGAAFLKLTPIMFTIPVSRNTCVASLLQVGSVTGRHDFIPAPSPFLVFPTRPLKNIFLQFFKGIIFFLPSF